MRAEVQVWSRNIESEGKDSPTDYEEVRQENFSVHIVGVGRGITTVGHTLEDILTGEGVDSLKVSFVQGHVRSNMKIGKGRGIN